MHTYADDRGHSLMSIFDHLAELAGQVNVSTMYADAVKAWHRHARQDDHWSVVQGDLKIGLYNTEDVPMTGELLLASPTPGTAQRQQLPIPPRSGKAIFLGEHRPGVLRIPAGLWHGGVAVGGRAAILLYYVTRRYDPQNPDEERLNWDAFPFAWQTEFK